MSVLVLAASPIVSAQTGGGTISNLLPTVPIGFANVASSFNTGATDTFSGTVRDSNKELDIGSIQIATTSGPVVSQERTIVSGDLSQTSEPGSFTSGWKVWNPTANDGLLSFKFQHTYSTLGTYVWRLSVKDEGAYQTGPSSDITVTIVNAITVAANPVSDAGTEVVGARWGAWSATPGATDVTSANYLKVTNSGASALQTVLIDFSSVAFAGVTETGESIPLDSKVKFAVAELDSGAAPSTGTYTFGSASADGQVQFTFTALGKVAFIKYQITDIPDPVFDQDYSASYTVSPV